MLLQTQKVGAPIAMLDVLEKINTISDTCYAAIDLANELFSIPIGKDDQK